ncbi:MAG TPA: zinc ABC transporter substrate-binding protein, partial [Polyangiaceae bacterium]|nr:zinc ABC transporter substrate-binding protein [Polyangiaceae bacterium]
MLFRALAATVAGLTVFVLAARPAHAALSVVATTPDLANVAAAVGGSRVRVQALALPTQDPHWVDARPSLVLDVSHADLLISVGAELELGWLPTLLVGARNGKIQPGSPGYLEAASLAELLERPTGKVDRSMGDIHPSGNPHFMFDPRQVERVAVGIGKRMSELDPEGSTSYLENTRQFVTSLRQARQRWEEKLRPLKGTQVISFHRSLSYLADWVGLVVVDHIEPKPGIPPNPRHVAELIAHCKQHPVRALLQESWYASNTSELIAAQTGTRLIKLPGASDFQGGQSYVAFLGRVVDLLAGMQ